MANLYFLIMSMLMLIGTYSSLYDSPITPWSTLATLFIVLSISMAKEALEDIKRHKADEGTNSMSTRRIGRRDSEDSTRAVPAQWQDVQVRTDTYRRRRLDASLVLRSILCRSFSGCGPL